MWVPHYGPEDRAIFEKRATELFEEVVTSGGVKDDDPRINPNGGSIAIGHPLNVTGTRIAYSAALELQLQNKKYALITMCVGVGQGYAAVIENINL